MGLDTFHHSLGASATFVQLTAAGPGFGPDDLLNTSQEGGCALGSCWSCAGLSLSEVYYRITTAD